QTCALPISLHARARRRCKTAREMLLGGDADRSQELPRLANSSIPLLPPAPVFRVPAWPADPRQILPRDNASDWAGFRPATRKVGANVRTNPPSSRAVV